MENQPYPPGATPQFLPNSIVNNYLTYPQNSTFTTHSPYACGITHWLTIIETNHDPITLQFLLLLFLHNYTSRKEKKKNDGHRRHPRVRRPRQLQLPRIHRARPPATHAPLDRRTRCFRITSLAGGPDGPHDGARARTGGNN